MGRETGNHDSKTVTAASRSASSPCWGRVFAVMVRWTIYAGLASQIAVTGSFAAMCLGLSCLMLRDPGPRVFSWWPDVLACTLFAASVVLLVGLVKRVVRPWSRWLLGGLALGCLSFASVLLSTIRAEDLLRPFTWFLVLLPVLINGFILVILLIRPLYAFIFDPPGESTFVLE